MRWIGRRWIAASVAAAILATATTQGLAWPCFGYGYENIDPAGVILSTSWNGSYWTGVAGQYVEANCSVGGDGCPYSGRWSLYTEDDTYAWVLTNGPHCQERPVGCLTFQYDISFGWNWGALPANRELSCRFDMYLGTCLDSAYATPIYTDYGDNDTI